jgi:predicted MFS family arabinose efflux permease
MIDTFGWRSPFLVLSLFSLIGASLAWFLLPAVEHKSHISLTRTEVWKVCLRSNVLASTGVAMFLFAAVGSFITVWGIWLSTDFDLNAIALGFVATAIAIAELGGAGLSSLFIDRIGKRRGSQAGLLLTTIAFLLIPFSQVALWAAISALILLGFFIEFAIVSLLPLYAEQAPEARATVFSLVAFGVSIGAAIGSPITAILWEQYGLWAVCVVAAGCVLIALSLSTRFLQEGLPPSDS